MKIQILSFMILMFFALSVTAQTNGAEKLDEFGSIQCDDYLARMDNFQIALNDDPTAQGYILIYEGKIAKYRKDRIDFVLPHFGEAKSYERTIIRRLSFRKFDKTRLIFIKAGFREKLTIEFWFVPAGAQSPKPTPTLKKMNYQKGKPISFCNGDSI